MIRGRRRPGRDIVRDGRNRYRVIVHKTLLPLLSMPHARPILEAPRLNAVAEGTRIAPTLCGEMLMRVAILLCGIFLTVTPLGGSDSLKISVSPAQSFAPANLFVRLSIEPNATNRSVEVAAESEDFYRSSQVALEGDQGPRTVQLEFRNLPGGHYEVSGTVADDRGRQVAVVHQNVYVLPSGRDR